MSTAKSKALETSWKRNLLIYFLVVSSNFCLSSIYSQENWQYNEETILVLDHEITVGDYLSFMDSICVVLDSLYDYDIDEYVLIRHNAKIISRLMATDYDSLARHNRFVFDQNKLPVLWRGDTLHIPTRSDVAELRKKQSSTYIDVNIPAFELRIIEDQRVLYTFSIRVGKNTERYLTTIDKTVDLRTKRGRGEIYRIEKNPDFVDPVSGKKYRLTNRDDGRKTKMPIIPWLEPRINGQRHGQMIHPTTNPKTLGKAYSNGCIGTSESAAWVIYYYAPIGTPVYINYDLIFENHLGETVILPDVYGLADQ